MYFSLHFRHIYNTVFIPVSSKSDLTSGYRVSDKNRYFSYNYFVTGKYDKTIIPGNTDTAARGRGTMLERPSDPAKHYNVSRLPRYLRQELFNLWGQEGKAVGGGRGRGCHRSSV
jgi:hypothetical protein